MINGKGKLAWEGIIIDPYKGRVTEKPRQEGKTIISDLGYGLGEVKEFLENCGQYIDRAKLAFGTTVIYSEDYLTEKIKLYRSADINVNPGGTCAEIAIYQGVFDAFLLKAKEFGFTTIEISDGTIKMDDEVRASVITKALEAGFEVISEVGKKNLSEQLQIQEAIRQIKRDLELGVSTVTVESRGSAKGVGIFDKDGKVKADDIETILDAGIDPKKLTWEAPTKDGQEFFITYFDNNVNLANVRYFEVIALEGLRRGLRGDTLHRVVNSLL
ncbi:MAG: phosphosulfolactate synthase [Peptococcaceae bacterium]